MLTRVLEGHTDWVRRVRPSGTSLVSSGRDGTAIVWDAMSGKAVTTIQHDVAVWGASLFSFLSFGFFFSFSFVWLGKRGECPLALGCPDN